MRKYLSKGFTLVELLIVIALLGVIATIVIAAINPIDQANKARDAGYKNDASEVVSAVQRYYASQSNFPWTTVTPATTADVVFPWVSVDSPLVGLCTVAAGCANSSPAPLVSSYELQTSFLSKSWINNTSATDKLYVGKAAGSSSGVYVCWVPKSNSNRQAMINNCLAASTAPCNMANLLSGFSAGGTPVYSGSCTTTSAVAPNGGWNTASGNLPACAECVPE